MNDFDQSFVEFQAEMQVRRAAEDWLASFETALVARDVARIGALFHPDSHWRDILAFTWNLSSAEGRDNVAMRVARRVSPRAMPSAQSRSGAPSAPNRLIWAWPSPKT